MNKKSIKYKLNELYKDNKDILEFYTKEGRNKNLLEKRYDNNIKEIEKLKRELNK